MLINDDDSLLIFDDAFQAVLSGVVTARTNQPTAFQSTHDALRVFEELGDDDYLAVSIV